MPVDPTCEHAHIFLHPVIEYNLSAAASLDSNMFLSIVGQAHVTDVVMPNRENT